MPNDLFIKYRQLLNNSRGQSKPRHHYGAAPKRGALAECVVWQEPASRSRGAAVFVTLSQFQGVAMFNSKSFEEFSKKFSELLAQSPLQDIEKNSRALLAQMFAKLDLVTREEFDVQAELLVRTREKLQELETRVAELEGRNQVSGIRNQ
jgi:ubiquinone biosynthesis accessory factor UbiK